MSFPLKSGVWTLDTAHSSVGFVVRHLGLSKVRGTFKSFDSSLVVGDELTSTKLTASIDMASIDTGNPDRDAHLQGADFFSAEANPKMTFESSAITGDDEDFKVEGVLSLNGVSKPVTLDVEFNGTEVFPMDQKTHAGFTANTTISRSDYGIDFNVPIGVDKVMIADKVKVELEIQMVEPEA